MNKEKSKAGKLGARARYAARYALVDELRALTTKKQLDDILKTRMHNNHLEQLIGWYKYVQEKKTEV